MNLAYVNNTRMDVRPFHAEIMESLKSSGRLPEEIADSFSVFVVKNEDGTPRYILNEVRETRPGAQSGQW